MNRIEIVSASAGSGKTYRLATQVCEEIRSGKTRPEAIIATTFTKKAAAELRERVRVRLISEGLGEEAQRLGAARIGTVHSVCGSLVMDFAFEKGLSPDLDVADEQLTGWYLKQALSRVVDKKTRKKIRELKQRFEDFYWQSQVQGIVEKGRANGLDTGQIMACAQRSLDSIKAILGRPFNDGNKLTQELKDGIGSFLDRVDLEIDTTKGTSKVVNSARGYLDKINNGRQLTWADWVRLSRLSPTKKSVEAAIPMIEAAAKYDRHPHLHEDIANAIALVFDIAASAMDEYSIYKEQLGVLDFSDQEVRALDLLREKMVQDRLRDQVDLLIVDEFQDTSPIQLAILLKLSDLAEKTVWVGDQKQSIYGFRDTDPALMDACVETLLKGNPPETLEKSWRSRPELVQLTSDVFAQAFANHGVSEDLVRLDPALTEPPGMGHTVERWMLKTKNKANDAAALASGIGELLDDPEVLVRTSDNHSTRRARPKDVAILCRNNDTCTEVAGQIERSGIAVQILRPGLMTTPEVRLLLTGLRLWVDQGDRLAIAELARIIEYPDRPDQWMSDLLDNPAGEAFADQSWAVSIREAARKLPRAGALEAFDAVLAALELHEICLGWGNPEERLSNLEALRSLAVKYVSQTGEEAVGSSPVGLINHFQSLAEQNLDLHGQAADSDAVTAVTWHRAKGLEWPITILFELHKIYDASLFGVNVAADREGFNVKSPLADRWIRYWPFPFQAGVKNTSLQEAAADLEEYQEAFLREQKQYLRLLYVGWTRARDILVLAARKDQLDKGLLSLLNHEGLPILTEPDEGKAVWAGREVEIKVRELEPSPPTETRYRPGFDYMTTGPKEHPSARLMPSEMEAAGTAEKPIRIGSRIPINGQPDIQLLGEAVHTYMAASLGQAIGDGHLDLAKEVLKRWNMNGTLRLDDLVAATANLKTWIRQTWPGAAIYPEWPIHRCLDNGSIISGIADLVVEAGNEVAIIDHKTFPGATDLTLEKAAGFAGQLKAYGEVVSLALGKHLEGLYIHLPVLGMIVRVEPE